VVTGENDVKNASDMFWDVIPTHNSSDVLDYVRRYSCDVDSYWTNHSGEYPSGFGKEQLFPLEMMQNLLALERVAMAYPNTPVTMGIRVCFDSMFCENEHVSNTVATEVRYRELHEVIIYNRQFTDLLIRPYT
jgi:hypothetical protein